MEYWDLVDDDRHPLEETHLRGETVPFGTYHVVVLIYVVNSKGEILSTLRAPEKFQYANCWEVTAGSVLAGENSKEGACRELREETGIIASPDDLFFLGTVKRPSSFVDQYILRRDISIEDLVLQAGETVAARWLSLEEFETMMENKTIAVPEYSRYLDIKETFLSAIANLK